MRSHRGSQGVFAGKKAREINFSEVVEAIEGLLAINRCLNDDYQCECGSSCGIKKVWSRAQQNLTETLLNTTLADLNQEI